MVQARAPATSIFEYLTHENPRLSELARSYTQSRNEEWYTPERVEKWKDFDFSMIKKIFEGKLWAECRAPRSPAIVYPPGLLPEELLLGNEEKGKRILSAWTVRVVNNALDLVRKSLNPVIWVAGGSKRFEVHQASRVETDDPRPNLEEPEPRRRRGTTQDAAVSYRLRENPRRTEKAQPNSMKRSRSTSAAPGPASKKVRSLVPDGEGIRIETSGSPSPDRLPSDIKGKWESREVTRRNGRYLNRKGRWRNGMSIEDQARPLRQIYTYCVEANARYGFIITCGEVLLVRVSPLEESKPGADEFPPEELVQDSMIEHGRLEYKSIRWGAHRSSQQSLDDFHHLTVNLSLWTLFILAGNNSQIGWDYKPLEQECLARAEERRTSRDRDGSADSETTETSANTEIYRKSSASSSQSTKKAPVWHPRTNPRVFVVADHSILSRRPSMAMERWKVMMRLT